MDVVESEGIIWIGRSGACGLWFWGYREEGEERSEGEVGRGGGGCCSSC